MSLVLPAVPAAWADIYLFVDEQGGAHFTDAPVDRRYRLLYRTRRPDPPPLSVPSPPSSYDHLIHRVAEQYALDRDLLKAIIKVESNFNPKAISRAGALGLMQLLPTTAQRWRVRDPFDPAENIAGGARHLRFLLDAFRGDLSLTLAAYNAGEEMVMRYGAIPPIRETTSYVQSVLRYFRLYRGSP